MDSIDDINKYCRTCMNTGTEWMWSIASDIKTDNIASILTSILSQQVCLLIRGCPYQCSVMVKGVCPPWGVNFMCIFMYTLSLLFYLWYDCKCHNWDVGSNP